MKKITIKHISSIEGKFKRGEYYIHKNGLQVILCVRSFDESFVGIDIETGVDFHVSMSDYTPFHGTIQIEC